MKTYRQCMRLAGAIFMLYQGDILSVEDISKRYGLHPATVYYYIRKYHRDRSRRIVPLYREILYYCRDLPVRTGNMIVMALEIDSCGKNPMSISEFAYMDSDYFLNLRRIGPHNLSIIQDIQKALREKLESSDPSKELLSDVDCTWEDKKNMV